MAIQTDEEEAGDPEWLRGRILSSPDCKSQASAFSVPGLAIEGHRRHAQPVSTAHRID